MQEVNEAASCESVELATELTYAKQQALSDLRSVRVGL